MQQKPGPPKIILNSPSYSNISPSPLRDYFLIPKCRTTSDEINLSKIIATYICI